MAAIFVLWLLGFINLAFLNTLLFSFNGVDITIKNLLLFLLILWLIGLLPRPFREIASILFIVWVISLFGFIAIAGLQEIIILALIIGAAVYLIKR